MAGLYCRGAVLAAATSSRSATNGTFVTPKPPKPAVGVRAPSRRSQVLRSADFRRVYDNGVRFSDRLFAAFCLARSGDDATASARLGLTVPRAIGGAVSRNRIKRRLREAFRIHRDEAGPGWDIVLNPRRAVLDAPFSEIEQALGRVIARCNSRS